MQLNVVSVSVTCLVNEGGCFPQEVYCQLCRKGKISTGKTCHCDTLSVGQKTLLKKHCISTKRQDIFRNSNTISQGNAFLLMRQSQFDGKPVLALIRQVTWRVQSFPRRCWFEVVMGWWLFPSVCLGQPLPILCDWQSLS